LYDPLFLFFSVTLLLLDVAQAWSWYYLDVNWEWTDLVSLGVVFAQVFLMIFQVSAYDAFYRHSICIDLDRHRERFHPSVSVDSPVAYAQPYPSILEILGEKPLDKDLTHKAQFIGVGTLFPYAKQFLHSVNMSYRLFILIKSLYVYAVMWIDFMPGTYTARLLYLTIYQAEIVVFHIIFWVLPSALFSFSSSIVYRKRE
jgi:hypothetical protein